MGEIILRPTSDQGNTFGINVGGTSLSAALADSNTGTWASAGPGVGGTTAGGKLLFDDPAVPADAAFHSIHVAVIDRFSTSSGNLCSLGFQLYAGNSLLGSWNVAVSWLADIFHFIGGVNLLEEPSETISVILTGAAGLNSTLHIAELYVYVYYVAKPELTVDAPTGTETETNRPAITWTPDLDSTGEGQTHVEVKVFDDATYGGGGFDPDTSTPVAESGEMALAAASWDGIEDGLPNDTYRAYVRVAQTVNNQPHWSDWAFVEFTVDVPVPAVPTLVATGDDAEARIAIDLEEGVGGEVSSDLMQVQRSYDGGTTWEDIRGTRDAP